MTIQGHPSRRAFLKHSASLSAATLVPMGLSLAGIGAASAEGAGDYKALVCVFLNGGSDHFNTLIPYDDRSYGSYIEHRQGVAPGRDRLAATAFAAPSIQDGRQFAFHPTMSGVKGLFDQKKLAIIGNAGSLLYPVTDRRQIDSGEVPIPDAVSGHPEQASMMQRCGPDFPNGTGWAGRMGDLLQASNAGVTSICMSTASDNWMQNGSAVRPISVGPVGVPEFRGLSGIFNTGVAGTAAFRALQMQARATNVLEQQWVSTTRRSIEASSVLNAAMAATPALATPFDGASWIGVQLQTVARLIAARGRLSQRRQIFFVEFGGFDHHSNLAEDHGNKLGELSRALASFYQATVELGVADQVTSFTSSDFGRTLSMNSSGGTDHGWGGHYLVMGGAVKGGDIYGKVPEPLLGLPTDFGNGRSIPGVSMEEYHAPMARWMGVSDTDLRTVIPNLGRYARPNLGYMA